MRKTIPLPPLYYLHRRLVLSLEGALIWRERPVEDFSAKCYALTWNKRFAGKKAGADKGRGYDMVRIDGVAYQAHRIAYAISHGADPGAAHIDHKDGARRRNHGTNLRAATNAENIQHRTRKNRNNTSGVHGVYWHKTARKWAAGIKVQGRKYHLGVFDNIEQATIARKAAEQKYFGRFAPTIREGKA